MGLETASVGMAAQVLLAGCLPSHAKLRGNLWPPKPLADGGVDEFRQFCFGVVSLDPGVPDLL
jgi:hypothetical protein